MYWAHKKVFTIDIPKTACASRWAVAQELYGKRQLSGHMTMSFAINRLETKLDVDYNDIDFWSVVRHPEKRLLSACNYHYKQRYRIHKPGADLGSYLTDVHESKYWNGSVYRSQISWLDRDDIEVRIWPLEYHDDMLGHLGRTGPTPRENISPPIWTMEELRSARLYTTFMNKYKADWDLYDQALSKFSMNG